MNKKRILIIEDEIWLAEQEARVLHEAGYVTKISRHAIAAINHIDDFRPDAIILDVLLTGSTAFALMHELQSYSDTGSVPIILCTNLAADIKLDDVKSYGVHRILDKATMQPEDLVVAVKSVL